MSPFACMPVIHVESAQRRRKCRSAGVLSAADPVGRSVRPSVRASVKFVEMTAYFRRVQAAHRKREYRWDPPQHPSVEAAPEPSCRPRCVDAVESGRSQGRLESSRLPLRRGCRTGTACGRRRSWSRGQPSAGQRRGTCPAVCAPAGHVAKLENHRHRDEGGEQQDGHGLRRPAAAAARRRSLRQLQSPSRRRRASQGELAWSSRYSGISVIACWAPNTLTKRLTGSTSNTAAAAGATAERST